jgi:leucyl aminopeptidase
VLLPGSHRPATRCARRCWRLADASYVYTTTKSKAEGRVLRRWCGVPDAAAVRDAFARVAAVKGVELAKEWGNRPANHATPTHAGRRGQAAGQAPASAAKCWAPRPVAKLGMGSFMAVAQGSAEPLRFIVLRYNGAPQARRGAGGAGGQGHHLRHRWHLHQAGPEMDEMKFDMCGAASVLGVLRALASCKPGVNVVGLIPTCENMPDGRAVKPGDVVTSMSGQTIEILNTDAEGRLILCDALTYAERFKPRAVVDIATLTGACVIALGAVRSGLFARTTHWPQALHAAGEQALDPCWRMPLDDDYAEGLKTNFADMANVAGRPAAPITAAKFLQKFTAKISLGAPGHRRHGLEERRRQGRHRAAGGAAAGLPAARPAGEPKPARSRWKHYTDRGYAITRHDLALKEQA